MADNILSPGVFDSEKDLTFSPSGVAELGAAIIGPTTKGPAFVPTRLTNYEDFKALFGDFNEETYVPYTVKSYLKAASSVTVVRVLQEGGYTTKPLYIIHTSGSISRIVGSVLPTTTIGTSTGTNYIASTLSSFGSTTGSFPFTLSGSNVAAQNLTASANPSNINSFKNVLGTSVKGSKNGYLYTWFSDYLSSAIGLSGSISFKSASADVNFDLSSSTYGAFQPAGTPYITSQLIGGTTRQLFKFYTLADGDNTNTSVKVSVTNTVMPGQDPATDYGTFTVLVRAYDDTDQRPEVLETFSGLNLDPDSSDYIARRIGDRSFTITSAGLVVPSGDYRNVSKYIRVSVTDDVKKKAMPASVAPYGYEALFQTISSSYYFPASTVVMNKTGNSYTEINSNYNKRAYYGWDFSATDNGNWLKAIPYGAIQSGSAFNLDYCFVHPSASKVSTNSSFSGGSSISGSTFTGLDVSNILKFSVPFQGGFDGMDPAIIKKVGSDITSTNVFGMNCSTATAAGSVAYIKALNVLSNKEKYDVNLFVTPGINIQDHQPVVDKAIEVAEDREDVFVIVDPVTQGSTSTADPIAAITDSNVDTSYAGAYWPWMKYLDTTRNKPVWVPTSTLLPRVIAYSDSVAHEWYAPAGFTRGGIPDAQDVEVELSHAQRDELYLARINPIAVFPGEGICVWGQKTLQAEKSAMQSINVRRLLIKLRKFIVNVTNRFVFENNTAVTRNRWVNLINPYLETVQSQQGLYAFKVVMDETNNTPDLIDQQIMVGDIFLQPARSAEFIKLNFNVTPTGVDFISA